MTSTAAPHAGAAPRKASPAAPPGMFFKPETFQSEQSVLYLLRNVLVRLVQAVNREMAMEEFALPQWMPLFKAWKGEANTVVDLARQCSIDVSTMTRMLDRLEKRGLVQRERSATDRRVVQIAVTPEGQTVARRVPQVLCTVYNRALAGFTAEEWAQLQSLVQRLGNNAEALAHEAGART